jgi:hypothetical protein
MSAHGVLSWMTVIGEAVLRSVRSVVRVAYGFSSTCGAVAACVIAETAAGALATARLAQNARELAESLTPIGDVVLHVMVSFACDACGGVTSSLECPAVCVPAEAASSAEVLAFGGLFDDLGSDRSSWKLSSGRVCCPVLRVMVSFACDACGGVTSSLECPAVCVPAEAASSAEVLAFGDLFDDLGSDRSSWKLSSGRVCCPAGRPVGVAISVGCRVGCGPAGSAAMADLVVLGEIIDALGVRRFIRTVSSVVVDCFVDRLVRLVGACGLVKGVRLPSSAGFWGAPGTMGSPAIPVRRLPMLVCKMGLIA